jgi:hypothetical protein
MKEKIEKWEGSFNFDWISFFDKGTSILAKYKVEHYLRFMFSLPKKARPFEE